jgi:hypothetical protein
LKNIVILKSVFLKNRSEHHLFWSNLQDNGKELFINAELEGFISEDFETDRYHISCFLDQNELCDSFHLALSKTNILFLSRDEINLFDSSVDWFTQHSSFTLNIFYMLLKNLNVLNNFKLYMFEERKYYHELCCDCGYPLIIPEDINFSLLQYIIWGI